MLWLVVMISLLYFILFGLFVVSLLVKFGLVVEVIVFVLLEVNFSLVEILFIRMFIYWGRKLI